MPDPIETGKAGAEGSPEAAAAEAAAKGKEAAPAGNLMDDANKEAKAAEEAENKRLLETDDDDLEDADLTKKAALIEANKVKAEAEKAPEKYEFKVPEGMEVDQEMVDKFTPAFKELGLSQARAQKLVDIYSEARKADAELQAATFTKFVEELKAETIKELGADYKKELSFAAKSRDRFASPELIEKLNQSGLANDKDMVKLFITIGKAVSEGKVIPGKPAAPGQKPPEEVLFSDANKK